MNEEAYGTVAGFFAGVLNAFAVGPLDVVKARQQIQRKLLSEKTPVRLKYQGTLLSLLTIYREEGIRGLYRGFQPTIIGYAPAWAIYFTCYNRGKAEWHKRFPDTPNAGIMVSAVASGAISNTVTNPIWVIRTRLQTQDHVSRKPEYAGTFDAARKIFQREGVLAFYKGMVPSMWGLLHVAIQFPIYEKLKHTFDIHPEKVNDSLPFDYALRLIGASSTSKLTASLITYPLEVVRTRMQVQRSDGQLPLHYNGVVGSFKTIIREEGFRGLYVGLQTNLIRVVPACAITFTSYELLMRWLRKLHL
jgi:solute carrier family 25 folate transporter 32